MTHFKFVLLIHFIFDWIDQPQKNCANLFCWNWSALSLCVSPTLLVTPISKNKHIINTHGRRHLKAHLCLYIWSPSQIALLIQTLTRFNIHAGTAEMFCSYVSKAPFNNLVPPWVQVMKFSMKNGERRQNTFYSPGSKMWICSLGPLYQQAHLYANLLFLWHLKKDLNWKVNNKPSACFLFPSWGLHLFFMTGMVFCTPNLYFCIPVVDKKVKWKIVQENMKLFPEASNIIEAYILIEWWNKIKRDRELHVFLIIRTSVVEVQVSG